MFNKVIGKVATQHEQLFNTVEEKMKKLRLGLKSYRYFDQAKALADKLGIALNESVLEMKVLQWLFQFIVLKIWQVF